MIRRAVLILLMISTFGRGQDMVPRMQEIVQSFVADKSFMGTVLVAKGDTVLLDQGYGSADLEWQIANVPAAKFRIGSLTKQFTATSILLLEERGKLQVSDRVKKYMPDAPAAWDKITIYNLLTHTSGIPNFTGFPEYQATEWKETTPAELVARFRVKPLDFAPGNGFVYSNSGYVLLGYLIEKISGQSYGEFLQQNIFTPLGMLDSGIDDNHAILLQRAQGYVLARGGFTHAGYVSMTVPFSAGDIYSTTGDLLKWERGLFGMKVVSAASLKKMTTPFLENYAFGLQVESKDGHRVIHHNGGIEGFSTDLEFYPDDGLTVVVLSNVVGRAPGQISDDLRTVALGGKVVLASERTVVDVPVTTLEEYVGTYHLTPTFSIVMTVEGGQLMTQATGQEKYPLFAASESKFFLKVVPADVEFLRDPVSKKVDRLVLFQAGHESVGKKQ